MAWSRLPEFLAWSQNRKCQGDAGEVNKARTVTCNEEGRKISNVNSSKLLALVLVKWKIQKLNIILKR